MIRFTVYNNNSTTTTQHIANGDVESPHILGNYVEQVQQSLEENYIESYGPSSSIICYSSSDDYGQTYHSPVYNLSSRTLQMDQDWMIDSASMESLVEATRIMYKEATSQRYILKDFVLQEQSALRLQMFNQKQQTKCSEDFLSPGLIATSPNFTIYELPPTSKLIQYYTATREQINDQKELRTEKIPLPWQVYVAVHDVNYNLLDTFMYFAKDSILKNGFGQNVFLPFMPNFYSNGLLCRPFYESYEDVSRYAKNIAGVTQASYDAVWNSGWNFDLYDGITENGYLYALTYHEGEFKDYLYARDLKHVHDSLKYYALSSSPISRFDSLVHSISKLTPEDMLHFPYVKPSFYQVRQTEDQEYIEELYNNFVEELSEEEREDEEQVQEMFSNHMEEVVKPSESKKERQFYDVFHYSVYYNHCRRHYRDFLIQNNNNQGFGNNENTYSKLLLYFQNNFACK